MDVGLLDEVIALPVRLLFLQINAITDVELAHPPGGVNGT